MAKQLCANYASKHNHFQLRLHCALQKQRRFKSGSKKALKQAWTILRYLVATINLDMKKLLPGAEILYSRTIYSLENNSRTKKILVTT
jgi:hypothetical protein